MSNPEVIWQNEPNTESNPTREAVKWRRTVRIGRPKSSVTP